MRMRSQLEEAAAQSLELRTLAANDVFAAEQRVRLVESQANAVVMGLSSEMAMAEHRSETRRPPVHESP